MKDKIFKQDQNADGMERGDGKVSEGGVSNTPSENPLHPSFGIKKSVGKHFDYFTFHIGYRRNLSFDPKKLDMNLLGIVMELCKALKIDPRYEEGRGGDSFRKSIIVSEEVHLLYDATYVDDEIDDVMRIDIKGHELAMFLERGGDLKELYRFMKKYNGFAKRVDLAIDLFEPLITLDEVKRKLQSGEVSCKSRKWQVMPDYAIGSDIAVGESIYIGDRRSSGRYMNIYDKLAEQLSKRQDVEEEYWLRFELRLKDDWADNFVNAYFESETPDKVFDGAIRDFIDFKEEIVNEGHKSRDNETWSKWLALLDGNDKVNVSLRKLDQKTMSTKIRWLERSCSKTLTMLYLAHKLAEKTGMLSFLEKIGDLISIGFGNLDNCDLNVLENYCGVKVSQDTVDEIERKMNGDFNQVAMSLFLSEEGEGAR